MVGYDQAEDVSQFHPAFITTEEIALYFRYSTLLKRCELQIQANLINASMFGAREFTSIDTRRIFLILITLNNASYILLF